MKRLIQGMFGAMGYQISRKQDELPTMDRLFSVTKKLGFKPSNIIDVGANHGRWTRCAVGHFPDAAIIMIEPQDYLKSDVTDLLKRPNIKWLNAGAGAQNATMKFTIAPQDHSSTFSLSSDEALRLGLKQVDVPVVTLNKVVADNGGKIPELVKIDAEGLDLKVMEGASDLVGKTDIFLLEAAVNESAYENRMARMIRMMDELGYKPFDITDLNFSPTQGVLWLVEIAFVKKGSSLLLRMTPEY